MLPHNPEDGPPDPDFARTVRSVAPPAPLIIRQVAPSLGSRVLSWAMYTILMLSLAFNIGMYSAYQEYFGEAQGPSERYHSGSHKSRDKIALIRVSGTIMPPSTKHVLKSIEHARDDASVKGVLLVVDSPGGFVADSHQIYHRLTELREKKPIYVAMQTLAASGGYYVAMGAGEKGKIFAEPTTWTGSIGVIIPHYEVMQLAEKVGVKATPLMTGPYKDTLSPFREMRADERELWTNILQQTFDQFIDIIDANRANLDREQVQQLATGQIYTAKDALQRGLIDAIGYEEDALRELQQKLGLKAARVITYHYADSVWDVLVGSAKAPDPTASWRALLDATVPRAMYYFSGVPGLRL